MKMITIGILLQDQIQSRIFDIARGEYEPKRGETKIWVASMKDFVTVFSDENWALVIVIQETYPYSIRKLDKFTRRPAGSLSRTLKTMPHYGLMEVKRGKNRVIPVARAAEFRIVAT